VAHDIKWITTILGNVFEGAYMMAYLDFAFVNKQT
jgi:hypothetical protein